QHEQHQYIENTHIQLPLLIHHQLHHLITIHHIIIQQKITHIDPQFLNTFLKITQQQYHNLQHFPNSPQTYNSFQQQPKKFTKAIIHPPTPRIYYS
ncbi:hypothetical protein, partial [Staphylococcus epidermidis]|uniref:hypothetical protein n=1 Tax=Staphylococcus epidermidis TaxID=1282 RepID=UPI0037DA3676